ncbi:MAG: hypothetical protein EAZ59_22860 [Oscillatoriales cyanobacterium]|nr:MAG: hypothetical protein EAZ59_22860 [Oscillatoriales cyanobacterium]
MDVNNWLKSEQFHQINQALHDKLNRTDEVRVIVQTEDNLLRKLPWHRWEFFDNYCHAEVALSRPESNRVKKSVPSRKKVRILAVLGDSTGINLDKDRKILNQVASYLSNILQIKQAGISCLFRVTVRAK